MEDNGSILEQAGDCLLGGVEQIFLELERATEIESALYPASFVFGGKPAIYDKEIGVLAGEGVSERVGGYFWVAFERIGGRE